MTKDLPAYTIGYLVVTQGPKPSTFLCYLEGRPYILLVSGPEAYQTFLTQGMVIEGDPHDVAFLPIETEEQHDQIQAFVEADRRLEGIFYASGGAKPIAWRARPTERRR